MMFCFSSNVQKNNKSLLPSRKNRKIMIFYFVRFFFLSPLSPALSLSLETLEETLKKTYTLYRFTNNTKTNQERIKNKGRDRERDNEREKGGRKKGPSLLFLLFSFTFLLLPHSKTALRSSRARDRRPTGSTMTPVLGRKLPAPSRRSEQRSTTTKRKI